MEPASTWDVRMPLNEQISLVLSKHPRVKDVFSMFRDMRTVYHVFHQEKSEENSEKSLLFRVEDDAVSDESLGVYELIGGVNPTNYRRFVESEFPQSPFERYNPIVVDVHNGKKVNGIDELATLYVSVGDQLIARPISGKRARNERGQIVTLSGVVIAKCGIKEFEYYAEKFHATEH